MALFSTCREDKLFSAQRRASSDLQNFLWQNFLYTIENNIARSEAAPFQA